MIIVDEIFGEDRRNSPSERALPWEETRDGISVVVEPKPHWVEDMRAFNRTSRDYCYYQDWTANGARARFFHHVDTSGEDVMMKARAMIAREVDDGLWL